MKLKIMDFVIIFGIIMIALSYKAGQYDGEFKGMSEMCKSKELVIQHEIGKDDKIICKEEAKIDDFQAQFFHIDLDR